MTDIEVSAEVHEDSGRETLLLNKDLERMIESMENISVQLAWMAYDMVVLHTCPDLGESLKRLEDEFLRCKAVICHSAAQPNLEEIPEVVDNDGSQE